MMIDALLLLIVLGLVLLALVVDTAALCGWLRRAAPPWRADSRKSWDRGEWAP